MLALRASSKPQELEMLAKRPQKRLHEPPKRCQMALRRPRNRPRGVQEASGGPFEPLQSPRSREKLPSNELFSSLFEAPGLENSRARSFRKPLRAMVEATVEEASKLCDTTSKKCSKKRSKQRSKTLRSSYEAAGLEAA